MNRILSLWPVSAEHEARLLRYHESPFYPRRRAEGRGHDVSQFWQRWVDTVHVFPAGNGIGLLLSDPPSQPVRLVEAREVASGPARGVADAVVRTIGGLSRLAPRRLWDAALYRGMRAIERAAHARSYALASRALARSLQGRAAPAISAAQLAEIPQLAWHLAVRPDKAFYYAYIVNTLAPHLRAREVKQVLEIGPGSMHLAVTLHQLFGCRFVFVDLPETFNWGYATLAHYAPKATIALPNEIESLGDAVWDRDFVLLCPEQARLIPGARLDAAINCSSFQEMTYPIIEGYLALIRRALRPGGIFYCLNEVAFPFADGSRIEFERYAWPDGFDDLFHEGSAFFDDIEWRPRRHRLRVKRAEG